MGRTTGMLSPEGLTQGLLRINKSWNLPSLPSYDRVRKIPLAASIVMLSVLAALNPVHLIWAPVIVPMHGQMEVRYGVDRN